MMRVWSGLLAMCLGCGRLSFDALPAPSVDAATSVDAAPDSSARVWWDTDWNRRIKLLIDNTTGPQLTNFPLLVRLDPTRIEYADALPTGDDLRVLDGDHATPLDFDIEQWGTDQSFVWVRIPVLASASTKTIHLYYGNTNAPAAASSASTWQTYSLVYHLADIPMSGQVDIADSSPNNNEGATQGTMPVGAQGTGRIGGSLAFDGADDFITAPNSPSLQLTDGLTIQMWVFLTAVREQWLCDFVVPASESEANNHLYEFNFDTSNNLELQWEYGAGTDEMTQTSAAVTTPLNTWIHVGVTRDEVTHETRFYVNGEPYGTPISFVNNATGGDASSFYLAGEIDGTSSKSTLSGRLDEVRFFAEARTPGWMFADYRSMTDQLVTYSVPEPL